MTRRALGVALGFVAILGAVVAGLAAQAGGLGLLIANAPARLAGSATVQAAPFGASGLTLDVYGTTNPSAGAALRPTVIFFHGGSWERGAKEQYRFLGQTLAARGFVTVIPDYRKWPDVRFPAFMRDAAEGRLGRPKLSRAMAAIRRGSC